MQSRQLLFERTFMKQALRHLIIGTAVGVFSLGAYAQSTMTPPSPAGPKMTTTTQDDGAYERAKTACNAQTGQARADCLRKAKTAHDQGETDKGGGTGASGTGQAGAPAGNTGTTGGAAAGASSSTGATGATGATGSATGGTSGASSGTSGGATGATSG